MPALGGALRLVAINALALVVEALWTAFGRLPSGPEARLGLAAFGALLVTLGAVAWLAPFPFPLIGYGALPILGLALALSAAGTAREP